jgi:hypothetical protein
MMSSLRTASWLATWWRACPELNWSKTIRTIRKALAYLCFSTTRTADRFTRCGAYPEIRTARRFL